MHQHPEMFRWAAVNELVPYTIPQALWYVGRRKKGQSAFEKIAPAELASVEATLPYLNTARTAMMRLQLVTGMRLDEVCALKSEDIDRDWKVNKVPSW